MGLLPLSASEAQSVFGDGFEGGFPATDIDAARLLSQATFGPSPAALDEVRQRGVAGWVEHQLGLPPTFHLPVLQEVRAGGQPVYQNVRTDAWFRRALYAPDQLRQRMAFALSQIFVVSDASGGLGGREFALAQYYDLLLDHAFGNYRDLLEAVTLHPTMGVYLSMMGNQKPDPASNIRPDENYAREIMQLFSIGLVMLEADGSVRDGDPGTPGIQPIPTYDQDAIRGFAHVFTGWKWLECEGSRETHPWEWQYCGPEPETQAGSGWMSPMRPVEYQHDRAAKDLLSYQGVGRGSVLRIPADGDARSDLDDALDTLAMHPNVAPFISRQLIQRLVTSNPSPAYIGRISAVFNDDGAGGYGNLGAVLRAILLDPEARDPAAAAQAGYGKLREPLLRRTHLWRAMGAVSPSGRYNEWGLQERFGQAPLGAPSVFNFYFPHHSPPGEIADAGQVAPEFQITTDTAIVAISNDLAGRVFYAYQGNPYAEDDDMLIDLSADLALADQPARLVDRYNLLFMHGRMPPAMRQVLIDHIEGIGSQYNANWRLDRVRDTLALILTSAQYAVQR
nr:DUF1800 domain-containing protein [Lysobacter sp. CAU 1642]